MDLFTYWSKNLACKFHASSVQKLVTELHENVQRFCVARAYGGICEFNTKCI